MAKGEAQSVVRESYSSPEEEIAALEQRLAERRASLLGTQAAETEKGGERAPTLADEKQALHEEIERHIAEVSHPSVPVARDSVATLHGKPQTQQVAMLVELALEKGVIHAVRVAEQLKDPYLLSRLHEELVDHFYERIVRRESKLTSL